MIMQKKILCALLLSVLPALTYAADIKVNNETDLYGTAHFNAFISTCSSRLGDRGIIKPGEKDFTVPESVIKTVCGSKNCEAFVFNSKNCSGDKLATVVVNAKDGVISINNHAADRFTVVGGGTSVTIKPKSASSGFKAWIKSFF
jgi:hypothetical protein